MFKISTAFLTYFVALSSIGLIAQGSDIKNKMERIKSERLNSGYEPWNLCYVDGILDTQTVTDSLSGFSILVPDSHNLNLYEKDGFNIMQYKPKEETSKSDIVMEIWVKPNDLNKLENTFDKAITLLLQKKIPFRIGTQEINGALTYWIESYHGKNRNDKFWEVTFYSKQPISKSTILIKQKSFKKKRYHQDFCLYGSLIRNLKWQ